MRRRGEEAPTTARAQRPLPDVRREAGAAEGAAADEAAATAAGRGAEAVAGGGRGRRPRRRQGPPGSRGTSLASTREVLGDGSWREQTRCTRASGCRDGGRCCCLLLLRWLLLLLPLPGCRCSGRSKAVLPGGCPAGGGLAAAQRRLLLLGCRFLVQSQLPSRLVQLDRDPQQPGDRGRGRRGGGGRSAATCACRRRRRRERERRRGVLGAERGGGGHGGGGGGGLGGRAWPPCAVRAQRQTLEVARAVVPAAADGASELVVASPSPSVAPGGRRAGHEPRGGAGVCSATARGLGGGGGMLIRSDAALGAADVAPWPRCARETQLRRYRQVRRAQIGRRGLPGRRISAPLRLLRAAVSFGGESVAMAGGCAWPASMLLELAGLLACSLSAHAGGRGARGRGEPNSAHPHRPIVRRGLCRVLGGGGGGGSSGDRGRPAAEPGAGGDMRTLPSGRGGR